jgi:hypothetical protein
MYEYQKKHETVKVPLGKDQIDIDVKLAPLISIMWELEIQTMKCCEERWPGLACISFPSVIDVWTSPGMVDTQLKV